MSIPARPTGQDPQSYWLWYVVKQLEDLKKITYSSSVEANNPNNKLDTIITNSDVSKGAGAIDSKTQRVVISSDQVVPISPRPNTTGINGTKYVDNTTGKMVYMLIREDYNTNDLLTIDTTNAISCEFSRLSWNETVSSISVNFTDAENLYEVSTIPYHDLANMMIERTIRL